MGLDDFGRRGSREHLPINKIIQLLAPTTRAATSRRASAHVEGAFVDEESRPCQPVVTTTLTGKVALHVVST